MERKSVIIAFFVLVLLAIAGSGSAIYYFAKYQGEVNRVKNPQAEAKALLAKVGKLMDLPTGEEPTIATVQNVDAVKNQPFFTKAQNGYRVILYTNARLAILFDEKNNKIINVGTMNAGTPSATQPTP